MPENYIAMFNAPSEEESRVIVAKAKPVLERTGELIRQRKDLPAPKAGALDKLKSGPINKGFYKFYVKADAFFATDACTSCGICVEACPLNNIRLSGGRPVWDKHCTHCMACICGCPTQAIEYGFDPARSDEETHVFVKRGKTTPENINGILDDYQAVDVKGIICFGMGVTLRAGNREYFYRQLDRHFPGLKEEYIRRYGSAYLLDSPRSRELMALFHRRCQAAGILHDNSQIFQYLSQLEERAQMRLF